jgi:hypothetical protein
MSLPSVTEEPHFNYSSFRVRGKIFATVPPEEEHLHVFVEDEQRQIALAVEPEAVEKLLWGKRVVGLRICLAKVKPALVNGLLSQAWARKAPKSLVASAGPARTRPKQ